MTLLVRVGHLRILGGLFWIVDAVCAASMWVKMVIMYQANCSIEGVMHLHLRPTSSWHDVQHA